MNKAVIKSPEKPCFRSAFTLTFAIEILGIESWHDFKEGSLDLETYSQALKIQYNLYPGNTFDVDVLIWPHCAKLWYESNSAWVRTWQFLERRWLCFSISHLVPVRVRELSQYMLTVTPTYGSGALGNNARNDKNDEVYIPRMKFGERRYFAPVNHATEEISMVAALREIIWKAVEDHIPASYLDCTFNTPQPVSDVRHQDAVLYYVREIILNLNKNMEDVIELDRELSKQNGKKATIKTPPKADRKFEIKLSGDTVLAGTGRIVPFEVSGELPQGHGEIVALISSANLPAQDDAPIVFVNVDKLLQIPLEVLRGARVSEIYTLWRLGAEERKSVHQKIKNNNEITINDHHSVALCQETGCSIVAAFLDKPLEIELRGIRLQPAPEKPAIFGYHKKDRDFDKKINLQRDDDDLDIIIAVCRVDAKSLANGLNGLVRGEYPLYPPRLYVEPLQREATCTNDINAITARLEPKLLIPAHVILEAQMSLEVSIGLVGCKLPTMTNCYSRLFCAISNQVPAVALLEEISLVNEQLVEKRQRKDVLTGFAVDTGELLLVIVEGPRDGLILRVWEMTEDYFPEIRSLFSTSSRYSSRLYPDMVMYSAPVYVLKMLIPLNLLLACPSVYVRPAVPIPARNAILKLGRMLSGGLRSPPTGAETPTLAEMRSFRLECCSPPKAVIDNPIFNFSPILPIHYNLERNNLAFSSSLDK